MGSDVVYGFLSGSDFVGRYRRSWAVAAGGGPLNPEWVAWLMGFPIDWLSSVPWETPSSRKSRKQSVE